MAAGDDSPEIGEALSTGKEVTIPAALETSEVGIGDDMPARDDVPTTGIKVSIPAAEEAPNAETPTGALETVIVYTDVYDETVSVVT